MTDPLTIFPADQRGLLDGSYKRVSYNDIGQHLLDGWEVARLTDEHFHPSDRHGIMMKMPTRRLVLDLPLPPSVNTMMRKLGNRSPSVQKWMHVADGFVVASRFHRRHQVSGPYILNVAWPRVAFRRWDCDNRIKILSDYLQRIEVIENDKLCWELHVKWSDEVIKGWCRVEIWPKE
jgi:Holliday junction resolvase RusA-like endonuclease